MAPPLTVQRPRLDWLPTAEQLAAPSRPWRIAILAALVAICTLFLLPLFAGGEPAGADLSIHLAEISQLRRALAAGDFNLWNPSANLGFASGYYYQVLPQLTVALGHLVVGWLIPLVRLFELAIVIPLVLLPVTCYRAARVSGVAPAAALGGAAAIAFVSGPSIWGMGPDAVFTVGLFTQPWGMLFFPLALAYGARYLGDGDHLGRAVGYAVVTGLCHPFFGAALAPALLVVPWWRSGLATAARRGGLLLGLVLLGTAFFWLPILCHYDSFAGFPTRTAAEAGMTPGRLLAGLARGELLDWSRQPSLLTMLLVAAPLVAYRHRRVAVLLGQAAIFAALLGAGPLLGKTPQDIVPAIRFLGLLQLALAMVAGITAVHLGAAGWRQCDARFAARPRLRRVGRAGLIATGLAAIALLVGAGYREMRDRAYTVDDYPMVARAELDPLIAAMKAGPPGRLVAGDGVGTGTHWVMYLPFVYASTPALRGYGGAALQSSGNFEYLNYFDLRRHQQMYAVRYLIARGGRLSLPGPPIAQTAHYQLYQLPDAGYFQPIELIGHISAGRAERRRAILDWLAGPDPERRRHLVVGDAEIHSGKINGRVVSERAAPSQYRAEIQVAGPTPGAFLLSATYHPGWQVRIDGRPGRVLRVSPDLMAIEVPPGNHQVVFTFHRPWWSWLLLLIAIASFAVLGFRHRLAAALRRPRLGGVSSSHEPSLRQQRTLGSEREGDGRVFDV